MNSPQEIGCGKCICYQPDEGKLNQGGCHRFPPQIVSVSAKTLTGFAMVPGAMFPQVGADWWCMEFKPRTKSLLTPVPNAD